MTIETQEILVLCALLELARSDRAATPARLAAQTRLAHPDVRRCVRRLDAAGWVDGARLRLTLPGLALAVGLAPRTRRRAVVPRRHGAARVVLGPRAHVRALAA